METTNFSFEKESLNILLKALGKLEKGFDSLPVFNQSDLDYKKIEEIVMLAAEKMTDNFPYFHPLYAGQMLKPPHPAARIAYMLSMWINPNNHALDGGRASSALEKEAVAEIAEMFGWKEHIGHLTSGGTFANLEALWVSGKCHPGKKIAASSQAHYTHGRISEVLGLQFVEIPVDNTGAMDVSALKRELEKGEIGTVVATMGTTAIGRVDPLPEILELKKQFGFRIHADAAYGGYFALVNHANEETNYKFAKITEADSIVVDPHKHGLQPYGCGCIVFKDPAVGKFYKHSSPYTYFSSSELHLGEISLECSRAGAGAVALWVTQKLLPLVKDGEFAQMLKKGCAAASRLHSKIAADKRFITAFKPELDIVIWGVKSAGVSNSSALARKLFEKTAENNLHLALTEMPLSFFDLDSLEIEKDRETITCLRSVLMKSEHEEWLEHIWNILDLTADTVLGEDLLS